MAQSTFVTNQPPFRGATARLQIRLLGPLEISRGDAVIELSGPKRRALLSLLAIHIDEPVGREQIIEALWPKRQTGKEESTLRVHVSHLRDELEVDRSEDPKTLVTRGQSYLLDGNAVDLDIKHFEALVTRARSLMEDAPRDSVDLLDEALSIWRGRALQDVEYEEFAQDEIRRLSHMRITAIRDRAEAFVAVGEDGSAIQDLEPLLRSDPANEDFARLLMRALYGTGRQAEALRVANRLARHLGQQGLEVSPSFRLLEEQILNHDRSLLPEGAVGSLPIKAGRSIRGYELRSEIGRGSVGVVFRAFQPAVGREVAVKIIDPELAQSPEFVRRFSEEARMIARLAHPHIVPLHDFWREPTGAFLVMRWMDGGSMAARLGTPWNAVTLARVFDQIADALGYAHSCGVVHRDVKPANILFDSSGNAYLSDFGLAVMGIDTGHRDASQHSTVEPPYSPPEVLRGEGPTVASEIFGLGVLLAEAASGEQFPESNGLSDAIWRVVNIATAANPADRFPDMDAFRLALMEAVDTEPAPTPRTVRRNPYKGLESFDEIDSADFYGREDVVESLLEAVAAHGLTAIIGASGSGKSSVVRAGLIPELRDGALPGSDEWFIVTMVPGTEPFDEFYLGLRDAAVGITSSRRGGSHELRDGFVSALDGPSSHALLIVDQFEELFSSDVDDDARERFLDNLVDLASEPGRRFRVVITMRADFSDRPLSHTNFGELMARVSFVLGPMRPQQLEDVIRGPAARVGVQVEPGLVSEIVRDVAEAPAYLPLLQYILSELFERRTEDRLTVQAYRSLGGVQGVLERRAESVFASLGEGVRAACRQLFLRMIHLGDHGEETRRRLPLTEISGLGPGSAGDEALQAFSQARLVTFDRDPVSRAPTVEVAHETVIARWTRYRVWIDEARADLLAQRRIAAAAATWEQSDEDVEYLLSGGPLASALDVVENQRVELNDLETRFVEESRTAAAAADDRERARREHETELEQRSRRRLLVGVGSGLVALVVAVLAVVAWSQSQRANDLAATQSRENLARELAAASVANLTSDDHDLSLLLAIAAAEETLSAGGTILPEAVDALHLSVINPRPSLIIEHALGSTDGEAISYSGGGETLAYVSENGEIVLFDPAAGSEIVRTDRVDPPASGVDFHPDGSRVLSIHSDGFREWDTSTGELIRWVEHPDPVSTAVYSDDGDLLAFGDVSGNIVIHGPGLSSTLEGQHVGRITSLDFDPLGNRLIASDFGDQSVGGQVLVWDLASKSVILRPDIETGFCIYEAAWHPSQDKIVVSLCHGEAFILDAGTGERLQAFSLANQTFPAMVFDSTGALVAGAGVDGFTRIFSAGVGGASAIELPNGGVPVDDVEFNPNPADPGSVEVAALGLNGEIRIWRDILGRSELPPHHSTLLYSFIDATPDGTRYIFGSNDHIWGLPKDPEVLSPQVQVIDAASGELLMTHETAQHLSLRFKPTISDDGTMVAFAGPSGNVVVANVDEAVSEEIPDSRRWALDLDFSSDGQVLAGGGFDGFVALWDLASMSMIKLMSPGLKALDDGERLLPDRQINEIEFRPRSTELVTAGADGSVRIWDTANGLNDVIGVFEFGVWSVDISNNGSTVAAAATNGSVRLLDIEKGDEILPRPESVPGMVNVVLSPDGRYLASGGPGSLVHLWDLASGEIVRRFRGAIGKPTVVFVNGGSELRAVGGEGIVRGYVLDPERLLGIAQADVSRQFDKEECQRYLRRSCDA